MQQNHIRALDGLRGVAALIVVFSHFSGLTGWLDYWPGTHAAHIGVMIFFVLSGFLMGYLTRDQPSSARNVADFMKRRVARVAPLYLLVVIASFALSTTEHWWLYRPYQVDASNVWDHLLFIRGVSVLWTIPVEIQFYLLFAVAFWTASTILRQWAWTLTAACLVLFKLYPYALWQATGVVLFNHAIGFFLAGLLIAQLYPLLRKAPALFWNAAFLAAAVAVPFLYPKVFMALTGQMADFGPGQIATFIYTSDIYLLTVAALVASAIFSPVASVVLGSKVAVWCGKISFSLYLLHMPTLWMLEGFTGLERYPWLFLLVGLPMVFIVAWLSYRLFERPVRTLINSLTIRRIQAFMPPTQSPAVRR